MEPDSELDGLGRTAQQLFDLTAELVAVPSVSHHEQELCRLVEERLRELPWLEVERIGDNLVARTNAGKPTRLILGGHLDTVPSHSHAGAGEPDAAGSEVGLKIDGDLLWGTGSADMKGGLAVFLKLAEEFSAPAVDVTYVFYAREEVARRHNGLLEVFELRPELLAGDVAILGEPTSAVIEAGCQGTMRLKVTLRGKRAHTARAWMGENAVHGLTPLLAALRDFVPEQPEVGGCKYHEALLAVSVAGGVAGNVVPDAATIEIGYRYAPDKTPGQAEAFVKDFVTQTLHETSDASPAFDLEVIDNAPPCAPGLDHQLFVKLLAACDGQFRAKLGWTDVAFFGQHGIPAVNFGPGDPELAHTPEERVSKQNLLQAYQALAELLR